MTVTRTVPTTGQVGPRVPEGRPLLLRPALTLAHRELQRFYRQRDRVIGAILQPLIFWVLFGSGLRASFRPDTGSTSMSSLEYLLPGIVVMIVLFTAIFATISVIEDRNEGFLQGVLAAPVPRSAIVLGKLLGCTALAVPQGILVLLLGPFVGIPLSVPALLAATGVLALVALALTGVGMSLAWRMESTQGFHAIMTVFLMPMWILSGSFFPAAGAPTWLRVVMGLNPLTYGVAALRRVLYLGRPAAVGTLPGLATSLLVTGAFAAATFGLSVYLVSKPSTGRRPS